MEDDTPSTYIIVDQSAQLCWLVSLDWEIVYLFFVLFFFFFLFFVFFFFQAEDGIRDLVRSRGLGDVYKRQMLEIDSLGLDPADRQMLKAIHENYGDQPVGLTTIAALTLSLIHI